MKFSKLRVWSPVGRQYILLLTLISYRPNPLRYVRNVAKRSNKKLSYCWETVRRESMPRIAEMDVEMTT